MLILYALIQRLSARQATLIGWLSGPGYFGIGVHWIYHSLHLFGAAIASLAGALTLVAFPLVSALILGSFAFKGLEFSRPVGEPLSLRLGPARPE